MAARLGACAALVLALRCVADRTGDDRAACLAQASARFARRAVPAGCPGCLAVGKGWVGSELSDALARTPGRRLACAGVDRQCRRSLARAAGRLFRARAACTAAYRAASAPKAARLTACRDTAAARFRTAASRAGRCGACGRAGHQAVAAEVGSLVDGFAGAWFCAR